MTETKATQAFALAGRVPACKLSHSYRSLPALAVCLATAAWGQTPFGLTGPHRPGMMSSTAASAKPPADTPASAQYRFITIGVPGSPDAQAAGINNDGLVSGWYQDASSSSVYHGFVWQAGVFQTVDYPGAVYTYLFAVNNRGVAVGLYGDGTAEYAIMYSVLGGTWRVFPDIPGYPENEGYGINDAGDAVGNAYSADFSTSVAWIWHAGTSAYFFFTVPGAAPYSTSPSGINDKGQVAGYFNNSSGVEYGFLKQGRTHATFELPGASATGPNGINNNGMIVGQWRDEAGAAQGFVLTSGGLFTTVDYPGPSLTAVEGINDHGDISGVYVEEPSGARKAYVGLRK
jgi:hypothetical protein